MGAERAKNKAMKDIRWILEVQKKTGRTEMAKVIEKPLMAMIENSLADSELDSAKMAECNNCGFVIDQDRFFDGCPNCTSKDWTPIDPFEKQVKM